MSACSGMSGTAFSRSTAISACQVSQGSSIVLTTAQIGALLRVGLDPVSGWSRLTRRARHTALAVTACRGGLPDRDELALVLVHLGLNDGTVISLPAIPVATRRASHRKRLRFGLATRHRDPLSASGWWEPWSHGSYASHFGRIIWACTDCEVSGVLAVLIATRGPASAATR